MAPSFSKSDALTSLTRIRGAEEGRMAPRVVVLVGIPGCGKTTFSQRLVDVGWARVSQDDMGGDRKKCERHMVRELKQARHVVVDRCNFDAAQRKHWVDYATARGCSVGVIVFAVPIGVCVSRVRERKNHPTLAGGEESVKVVHIMAENFVFPTREEGFSFCRVVKTEDDVEHVLNQLLETREK